MRCKHCGKKIELINYSDIGPAWEHKETEDMACSYAEPEE